MAVDEVVAQAVGVAERAENVHAVPAAEVAGGRSIMSVPVRRVQEGQAALAAPRWMLLLILLFLLVHAVVFVEFGDALDVLAAGFTLEQLLLWRDIRLRVDLLSVVVLHLRFGLMAIIGSIGTSGSSGVYRVIRRLVEFLLFGRSG